MAGKKVGEERKETVYVQVHVFKSLHNWRVRVEEIEKQVEKGKTARKNKGLLKRSRPGGFVF